MKNLKRVYIVIIFLTILLTVSLCASFAFFANKSEHHGKLNIVAGALDYKIESNELVNNQIIVLANTTKQVTMKITSLNSINSKYELYYILEKGVNVDIGYSSAKDSVSGTIAADGTKEVIIYIRNNTSSNQIITFGVEGGLTNNELVLTKGTSISEFSVYAEKILNGATPVLTDNLVPVQIAKDGTVTKANLYNKWYSYEDKNWANAIVLREKEVTTVKDSSGNGNDGIVYGNLVEGYGYASFDGTDDYIDTGIILDHNQPFSIAASFKYVNRGTRDRILNNGVLDFYINENGGLSLSIAYLKDDGSTGYRGIILSASNFNDNEWYDVVYTYDGYNLKCYLNGILMSTSSSSIEHRTSKYALKIGATYSVAGSFFDSKIRKVAYHSEALTEEQIKTYFSNSNTNYGNEVFIYNFFDVYDEEMTMIAEDNIESYFVWIPRYKYKIFNEGTDTGLTSISSSEQVIEVVFESKDVTPSTGSTVGSYLTHPAFTSFDTNGIWVGKFETGYDGATSTTEAQVNSNDSSKIIIKPNVYSWRSLTLGNMFDASYNYLRSDESHMMKNTEWGAVAYLQHSAYGSATSLRINNNSAYITGYAGTEEPTLGYNDGISIEGNRVESTALATDGIYTVNYLNGLSNIASTTENKSGVYDMSGGAWEYVMGYTTGATTIGGSSGITDIYSDFFTNSDWDKYYDKYSSTVNTNYNYRILGDATGEMGPFGSQVDPDGTTRYKSSWYRDYAEFMISSDPWFDRGGHWSNGTLAGAFTFSYNTGGTAMHISFRIVLAP